MTDIRITQLDGKLPNLALMRLSAFHKARGDTVHFFQTPIRQLGEATYGAVYGSAIFTESAALAEQLAREFPGALIGGTGTTSRLQVEDIVGDFSGLDYEPWPRFTASLGFTQRGCRLKCAFCVVPAKEGKAHSVATINDIWRGPPWPKHLHLLDNDFFGNPEWRERLAEVRAGGFKVCFNQGINVRILTNEIARELATVKFSDDGFSRRQLYTAWDSIGDERIFFRGVDRLEAAGISPRRLMAYMLVGYDPAETWAQVFYRFDKMVARGILPFPMVFGGADGKSRKLPLGGLNRPVSHQTLGGFQRWALKGLYRSKNPKAANFATYNVSARALPSGEPEQAELFGAAA